MKPFLYFGLGLAGGLVLSKFLLAPGTCCDRVAAGVRDRVGEELGVGAQAAGDLLGIWDHTPGLLDLFGVE